MTMSEREKALAGLPYTIMDPELAAMPPEIQGQVRTLLQQLATRNDPAELRMMVGMMVPTAIPMAVPQAVR